MPSSTPARRHQRATALLSFALLLTMIVALPGAANHAGTVSGVFESADGNLQVDHENSTAIDWNSFTNVSLAEDWQFTDVPDEKVILPNGQLRDDQYSGGTKQDDDCASITLGSFGGPDGSKVDLDNLYLAQKEIEDEQFLFIAWTRVAQNSTTNSSHVGYEFNKGTAGTCEDSDLLQRVEGDMLIVYDFPGGSSEQVQLKISRWLTVAGGHSSSQCEVAKNLPCWGDTLVLTDAAADGRVNTTSVGEVYDALNDVTRGVVEFGEAGINLTEAEVFDPDECESFGFVTGVSRSSGSSGSAAMKDLVGPADFRLGNCGALKIEKEDTAGDPLAGASFDVWRDGGDGVFGDPDDPQVDSDDEFVGDCTTTADGVGDCTFDDLPFGDYWVHETGFPTGYTLAAGQDNPRLVSISDEQLVTVTFVNAPEPGRIEIEKEDDDGAPMAGIRFELWVDVDEDGLHNAPPDTDTGRTCTTDATGVCREDGLGGGADADRPAFDNVPPGYYCVVEDASTLPAGYTGADPECFEVELTAGGDLVERTIVNPRTHRIVVLVCHEGTDTLSPSDVTLGDETETSLAAGTLTEAEQKALCDLGGASFGGLDHDEFDLTVDIADH
jgi:protocatechuate 3,4-dioxygenase beta subunit